jgi:CTP synthase (UTP-ammonia lyase)
MTTSFRPASVTPGPARVALVGDRSANVRADALLRREGIALDPYWIPTGDAEAGGLDGFDAIWLLPGSPYVSAAGAIAAARIARELGIPFLGTCGGFQHALLEYARDVCGLVAVENAETSPDAEEFLIVPLECSLAGHEEAVSVVPGSLAERILGAGRTIERYHCSFGLNSDYLDTLVRHGLRFTGHDDDGQVRIAELPGHPFFFATLFQPELYGDGTRPHPIVRSLGAAAAAHADSSAAEIRTVAPGRV